MNVIRLFQMKSADTAHMGIFWGGTSSGAGPGNEGTVYLCSLVSSPPHPRAWTAGRETTQCAEV